MKKKKVEQFVLDMLRFHRGVWHDKMPVDINEHCNDIIALTTAGKALTGLIDLTNQRIDALCKHLGVTTDIVPPIPAHYEVFPANAGKEEKSDDKTAGEENKDGD